MKARAWLLLLLGLGIGCAANTPAPPAQVLGLVEFTLENNGAQITGQSRWLESGLASNPNTMALTTSNLPVISPAGSATTSDLGGRRYLAAAFNLQNPASGVNYDNLSFYAVNVDASIAGGASLGGSSLRNLKDANGTAIGDAAVARGVKPTHKLVNIGGEMRVDASGADFQVFDAATEVQPVQAAINALPALNGHVAALGYGFVARKAANNPARAINAGQSGYVTLGLHFPIAASNTPRFLSLTYVVVSEPTTRITEALEEQGTNSTAATRAAGLGAGVGVNALPGSSLSGARVVCPVTWAVSSGALPAWVTTCQTAPPAPANYLVGPTRAFKTLQAVMGQLKAGDIVDVDGDATYPSLLFTAAGSAAKPILIRGQVVNGKRPVIQGFAASSGFAALKFVASNHVILEDFEITNGANADRRATTACVFNEADDVTLRRVKVRDCPNHGILGADTGSGSLTLQEVEVTGSGCDITLTPPMICNGTSLKHPIYIATDPGSYPGATLRIMDSYLHDNNAGENIKTRSERVQILGNWLETTPAQYRNLGLYGYQEYTAGVDAPIIHHDVSGNVFVERGSSSLMRTGGDGTGSTRGRTRFQYNTAILDASFAGAQKPVIRLDGELEAFLAQDNIFYVVGASGSSAQTLQLIRENDDLTWTGPKPKLLVTNNALGLASTLLRTVAGTVYTLSNLPPAGSGYSFEALTTSELPGFKAASSLGALDLHLLPSSALRGKGTADTGRAGFEIPWAVALPPRDAAIPATGGQPQPGPTRGANSVLTLGAFQ